jgi:uncharacterized protein (TIGR02001 family)
MKKFLPLTALATLTLSSFAVMPTANAEISASANIANMYFWRGLDISDGAPAFSGSVNYTHESGVYGGVWMSSEGHTAGTETDFYVGYAGKVSDFGYDVSISRYQYPEAVDAAGDPTKASDASFEEYIIGATYMDLGVKAFVNTDSDESGSYKYLSVDYSMGNIGLHAGVTSQDDDAAGNSRKYKDFNVSYAVTDMLTATVSKATGDAVKDTKDDVIFVLSLDLPIGKMNM